MRIERFRGRHFTEVLARIKSVLGEDALVLHTHSRPGEIEVVATTDGELERFRAQLEPTPLRGRPGRRPRVVALVGPTGSGKTTTAAKLALNGKAFAGARVGIISLDTYKIGAFEQVQIYADLANLELDLLAEYHEARPALARMAACDVILVDTPGRSPRAGATEWTWRTTLSALEPDETHLVLSATCRDDVADAVKEQYQQLGVTNLLLTKLDEVPSEYEAARLADRLELSARWVTDGQAVPDDIDHAPDRLLTAVLSGPSRRLDVGVEA
jgi:flagellar biosynthesis protein FlhF